MASDRADFVIKVYWALVVEKLIILDVPVELEAKIKLFQPSRVPICLLKRVGALKALIQVWLAA